MVSGGGDIGTFKDDNRETFEQWRERKVAEAAARKREAGLEQRLASLEKRISARYGEVVEAMTLAFGDLRGELDDRLAKERSVYDAEAQRLADLRETHEVLVARQVQRATKDANRAFASEIQKLRNEITFLERRVKELEGRRGTK